MDILVIGGAGYIGGATTDLLMNSRDIEFKVYDKLLYEEDYLKEIPFIYGDVRDKKKLIRHLDQADCIIILSALVGDGACAINPALSKEINEDSVKWICDVTKKRGKKIIFMSTCSVYGAQDGVLTEDSPINPLSVYASTKYEAEQYLINNHDNCLIFRLGTVFGVGDNFSRIRLDLVVNILTVRAATEGKLTVFGGDQFRPLIHVKDVAREIVCNLEDNSKGIYNLCKQNVRIVDLAYQVRNHFPDCQLDITEMKFEDSRNYRASSEKAINELGFDPIYSIDFGIEEIKKLVEENRISDIKNPKYYNEGFLKLNL